MDCSSLLEAGQRNKKNKTPKGDWLFYFDFDQNGIMVAKPKIFDKKLAFEQFPASAFQYNIEYLSVISKLYVA